MQSGQAGPAMTGTLDQLGRQRMLAMFADWTDRIANGEVPAAPRRPQGIERNVVITAVGLGRPEGVPARRRLDRPPQPDGQREREDLRRARGERRLPPGARPRAQRVEQGAAHGARSEHAGRERRRR